MYIVMMGSVKIVSRVMYVPRTFLLPVILVFCIIGAFALDNTMFDVWVMLGFGVVGFAMEKAGFPLGPFVIGFVLAPLMEEKLRSGLMMTAGSIEPIFTRPAAAHLPHHRGDPARDALLQGVADGAGGAHRRRAGPVVRRRRFRRGERRPPPSTASGGAPTGASAPATTSSSCR
ncbi:MAG: hypothetical protein AcusKO_19930 [Acuticoccus sp.]